MRRLKPSELVAYAGQWIAIDRSGGRETIVGSGNTLAWARIHAIRAGYPEHVLMRVPRIDVTEIPTAWASRDVN